MSVPTPILPPSSSPAPTPSKSGKRPTPIPLDGTSITPERGRKEFQPGSASRRGWGVSPSPARDGLHSAAEGNWRDRNGIAAGTPPSSSGTTLVPGSGGRGRGGPERTVGGFEKRGAASKEAAGKPEGAVGEKSEKAEKLSHVPCRFFKAGACTAGDKCPFSHEEGGKKEVCQWFLKGNCKFGHKCALAHVRPGEPMSMDRKNKKEQQRHTRDQQATELSVKYNNGSMRDGPRGHEDQIAPVPIISALSSSIQSPPGAPMGSRPIMASSPLREPYGPPSAAVGSPSAGFLGRSPGGFAASPSRPSPLSAGHSLRNASAVGLAPVSSLKSPATTSMHSPLRPPAAGPGVFSSSFSPSAFHGDRPVHGPGPLSASFADSPIRRSIWARSETPDEPLSPRKAIPTHISRRADVFDDDEDHGEDLLPSSLSDLLTPNERMRRMSRRDSNDSFGASPGRPLPPFSAHLAAASGERLAQSAGATMGPGNFLQSLWTQDGPPMNGISGANNQEFAFGPSTAAPPPRQSLLSQQRHPISPHRLRSSIGGISPHRPPPQEWRPEKDEPVPHFVRALDPSSPSAKALQEHAPGQSLPGGVATALSRLHLQASGGGLGAGRGSVLGNGAPRNEEERTPPFAPVGAGRKEEGEEEMFAMDG